MPRLDFAFLADAAEAEPGRKSYVIGGGIDSINAPSFPVVHPHMSLVMRILVGPDEAPGDHRIGIRLVDAADNTLARMDGNLTGHGPGGPDHEIGINMVINMVNTRFEEPGAYAMEITIDGEHERTVPLRLVHLTGPPPGHPG